MVVHHVRRAPGVDRAVLVRAVPKHNGRVVYVRGNRVVMIATVKLQYASVNRRRGRHLRGPAVFAMHLSRWVLMLRLLNL
jgi:hypothetical protein